MNDAPTGFRNQLRQAAYARLLAMEKLQEGLVNARTPLQKKMILEEVMDHGQRTIRQVGECSDENLITQTTINMAYAAFDLAELAETDSERENLIRQCVENCDLSANSALESEHSVLALDFLPDILALLVQVMDRVQKTGLEGTLLKNIQLTFARHVQSYEKAGEKQKKDRRQSARDLATAQLLYQAENDLSISEHRKANRIVMDKVLDIARQARLKALGASDREIAGQAEALIREIEALS